MEKSQKITLLASIVLIGFTVAVFYHYILGQYLIMTGPYKSFLWTDIKPFGDFLEILGNIQDFAPYKHIDPYINYFPLAYILLFPFTFIQKTLIAYFIFLSIFLSFFIFSNIKLFKCKNLNNIQNLKNIFILTFITYPFLNLVDRGNFDMLIFILFAFFIYFFKKEKYFLSAILIGIINAIKPFLWIFLCLFLFKKKYKNFFTSIFISGFLIIFGFLILKGGFIDQICTMILNLRLFKLEYLIQNNQNYGMFSNSSLYMALKALLTRTTPQIITTFELLKYYNLFIFFATIATIFLAWKENVYWKKITIFSLYMLTIPYVTNDYKLIFLFIPIWLFVNANKTKFDLFYTILFGLLFIPKNIIIENDIFLKGTYVSLSVILNPIIILVFFILLCISKKFEGENGKT